jgi:hypothetical protein
MNISRRSMTPLCGTERRRTINSDILPMADIITTTEDGLKNPRLPPVRAGYRPQPKQKQKQKQMQKQKQIRRKTL